MHPEGRCLTAPGCKLTRQSAPNWPFFAHRRRRCRHKVTVQASIIRELQRKIADRSVTASDVVKSYLTSLDNKEPSVQSFLTVVSDHALKQAQEIDQRIATEGIGAVGPLAGIPFALKDNICSRGVSTTAGSRVLEGYTPTFDATVTSRLKKCGAVLVGKTNMDEFGMGSSTEFSAYKLTRNPWDLDRVPGGSSGGSAAAVSSGQCVMALGSDTGGSIRQPAHFCGVVGLKPTYGRVSRYGLVAYASSLDVIGPLTTTVEDAALVMNAIAGSDEWDSTSATVPVPDFTSHIQSVHDLSSRPLSGRRVGVIQQTIGEGLDAAVQQAVQTAVQHLQSLGAEVEEVSLPSFDHGLPAYYIIALSEASSNLARYDGVRYGVQQPADGLRGMYEATRREGLGPEVKRRILMGTHVLSAGYYDAYYKRAQQVRTLIQREMKSALQQYDVLLSPVAPTLAYKFGEKVTDPLAMVKGDIMSVNLNLAGLPAIALPCALQQVDGGKKLPVGLQMIGKAFGEDELIGIAHIFEQTLGLNVRDAAV